MGQKKGQWEEGSSKLQNFKVRELEIATGKFREDSLLGEGGFGKVYLGWLKVPKGENGNNNDNDNSCCYTSKKYPVAIKRLKSPDMFAYHEWLTEVLVLGRLRHPHLVHLVGYCSQGTDHLMLVYRYATNASLDHKLFPTAAGGEILTWSQRVKVAVGAASGLSYLHSKNVIHRDLKASNVLLSEDMTAMLTDFGLAKSGPTGNCTHVSTCVKGTIGYLDPAYLLTGRLTPKSDVYALGVLLLELLCGLPAVPPHAAKKNVTSHFDKNVTSHEKTVTSRGGKNGVCQWARPMLEGRKRLHVDRLVDPRLEGKFCEASAMLLAQAARYCLREDPDQRPTSEEVKRWLEDAWEVQELEEREERERCGEREMSERGGEEREMREERERRGEEESRERGEREESGDLHTPYSSDGGTFFSSFSDFSGLLGPEETFSPVAMPTKVKPRA